MMSKLKERIILAESEGDELKQLLHNLDYEIIDVHCYDDILPRVLAFNPSLIIGDFEKLGRPVNEICRTLKSHLMVRHIPFVVVTRNGELRQKIAAAESGVSDYIVKPFQSEEAIARINRSIRDIKNALNANPLTRLPGNLSIQEHLEWMLTHRKPFAVSYFDIDHFKSFNDMYGYTAGDRVISLTANLILQTRDELKYDYDEFFVGHVGGDDYITICPENIVEKFCKHFIKKFDAAVPFEYDKETRERGFIIGKDRLGKVAVFPLVSISIAVVVNESGAKFRHIGEIACAGAEIKKFLKGRPGSSYLIDRRGFQKKMKIDFSQR